MDRRTWFSATAMAGLVAAPFPRAVVAGTSADPLETFPRHDLALVRQTVAAAHGDMDTVRRLVDLKPSLAKASWDWGFGDWESALDASAHTGRREIARYLLERGARLTIFAAAMLGYLEVVRAAVEADPLTASARGPHGITLLEHALVGGATAGAVASYLRERTSAEPVANPPTALDEIAGEYGLDGSADPLTVSLAQGRVLLARRALGANMVLRSTGVRTFAPAGAPAVVVRFTPAEGAVQRLVIQDGPDAVTATRVVR